MRNNLSADPDYDLWVLLSQSGSLMLRARNKELSQYDLTARQAAVLFIISAIGDKATPTDIAKWLLREPHSVSSILIRMEKEGLISKAKDLHKKSRRNVALTEKGKRALGQSSKRESIHEIMSCLSKEECQQLRLTLEKLRNEALNRITTVSKMPFP